MPNPKKVAVFKAGDLVFARVTGHPRWPAKVTAVRSKSYEVMFFGTSETGSVSPSNIWLYGESRLKKFGKCRGGAQFKQALEAIKEYPEVIKLASEGVQQNHADQEE